MGGDINDRGLSRRHILSSVEGSLRRLGTDRVEILFLHTVDPLTPVEETLRTLDRIVRQGKALHIGVSNWAAWQIALALGTSRRERLERFSCAQPMYNLVKRQAEVEIFPLAQAESLGILTYSPLGGGLFAGKYGRDRRPERGRLVENRMYEARYGEVAYYDVAEEFTSLAREQGVSPVTLAVAWVKTNPAVTAPIIGARNVEQLEPSLQAAEFSVDADLRSRLSALSPTPPLATDRSEEQKGVAYKGSEEKYK
jgi:aryl-alcohol dehydrogenase-like predicted oxidoreductase